MSFPLDDADYFFERWFARVAGSPPDVLEQQFDNLLCGAIVHTSELSSCNLIADGGYLAWKCIIAGYQPSLDSVRHKCTDWLASVRKDVECSFGILKCRFRWFKCPLKLHHKVDIDNAFVAG